jgi:hypothetical protein
MKGELNNKGKGKGRVVPVPKHHTMKAYWGVEVWLHLFFDLALDGSEWSPSRPG